ncbi:nucleotidyltransferase family protein [Yoonia sp.]|uniref:nucleotidyltransferase family protein n=1 Tax=Yoonia sp. TaxID=2212373 RepID=UPI0019DB5970|nr:nucleotidyltransferase family protein [Yoonia sp.]MBE0413882.1 nucleotidyltransferase family protein [Yoonia sp.]
MTMPILLFAAGRGTRMAPLTDDRPKPLIKVAGRALIDHALDLTEGQGLRVVNAHYKADMLRRHLAGRDIAISDETDLLRETGGGLRHALPLLPGNPVITMNTDAVWRGPNPVAQLRSAWRDEIEALLLLVPPAQVVGHTGKGDFAMDAKGRLTRAPAHVFSGVQMIRTDTLATIEKEVFSMNLVWDQMAARGGLFGVIYPGQWCDVGQPDSIPLAEAMLHV